MAYFKFPSGIIYEVPQPTMEYIEAVASSGAFMLPDGSPEVLAYLETQRTKTAEAAKQAEALALFTNLQPFFSFVESKGYPNVAEALLVALKDLPAYVAPKA